MENKRVDLIIESDKAWEFDAIWQCGMRVERVLIILEPYSKNPILQVPRPFGALGIVEALKTLNERRQKMGLTIIS